MKEIEEKLTELQGQHSDLTRSYEVLQVEYASVRQELEALRRRHEGASSPRPGMRDWNECRTEPSDPLLFDVSAFCCEPDEEGEQKGQTR
jgi:hypothetical protein